MKHFVAARDFLSKTTVARTPQRRRYRLARERMAAFRR